MRKIIIEVPDACIDCRYVREKKYWYICTMHKNIKLTILNHFRKNDEQIKLEPCPSCLAAEVNNLFNKHLENVLKEEKENTND